MTTKTKIEFIKNLTEAIDFIIGQEDFERMEDIWPHSYIIINPDTFEIGFTGFRNDDGESIPIPDETYYPFKPLVKQDSKDKYVEPNMEKISELAGKFFGC